VIKGLILALMILIYGVTTKDVLTWLLTEWSRPLTANPLSNSPTDYKCSFIPN